MHKAENSSVKVVDAPDTEGELALRRGWPSMLRGYLNDEERYRKCFAGDLYLTGDLARQDADGYFWFGPFFLDYQTYRFRAHSMFDPELYRDKAEVEEWKKRGPIHTFSARLKAEGKLTEEEFLALDQKVDEEVQAAVAFAEAAEWEPVEDLTRDVCTPGACA